MSNGDAETSKTSNAMYCQRNANSGQSDTLSYHVEAGLTVSDTTGELHGLLGAQFRTVGLAACEH